MSVSGPVGALPVGNVAFTLHAPIETERGLANGDEKKYASGEDRIPRPASRTGKGQKWEQYDERRDGIEEASFEGIVEVRASRSGGRAFRCVYGPTYRAA